MIIITNLITDFKDKNQKKKKIKIALGLRTRNLFFYLNIWISKSNSSLKLASGIKKYRIYVHVKKKCE